MRFFPGGFDHEAFWRPKLAWLARIIWRPRYLNFSQIPHSGGCLLVANHVSYVDGLIIAAGIDRPVRFVIDGQIYNLPIVHYFMRHNRAIPILPNKQSVSEAFEEIGRGLEAGDAICIFPEGKLTWTGSLSRFRPGIEWIIAKHPVPVYPIALVGLWGSLFSRKHYGSLKRWIPATHRRPVIAHCGEAVPPGSVRVNDLQRIILRLKHGNV